MTTVLAPTLRLNSSIATATASLRLIAQAYAAAMLLWTTVACAEAMEVLGPGQRDVPRRHEPLRRLGESTVFVNGSFNGWCGACNPMSDPEGDGIWSVTLPLIQEPLSTSSPWMSTNQENFSGGESCTSTIDGYTNCTLTFDADTDLDVVCRGSCEACPEEVIYHDLTLEVNTANIEVGPNGMYAGGGVLGDAQAVALADDDADGVWSATISVLEGTSGNYIFLGCPNDGGDGEPRRTSKASSVLTLPTTTTAFGACVGANNHQHLLGQCSRDGHVRLHSSGYDDVPWTCLNTRAHLARSTSTATSPDGAVDASR